MAHTEHISMHTECILNVILITNVVRGIVAFTAAVCKYLCLDLLYDHIKLKVIKSS